MTDIVERLRDCSYWLERDGFTTSARNVTDAAAEIDSLRAELAKKSDAIQRLWRERDDARAEREAYVKAARAADDDAIRWATEGVQQIIAERDALRAEAEALRKDAERYKWLRIQPNNTDAPRIDVVSWTQEDESVNGGEGLRLEELDAAIDAAMGGQKEASK